MSCTVQGKEIIPESGKNSFTLEAATSGSIRKQGRSSADILADLRQLFAWETVAGQLL
jgi:hypothetical protein